MCGKGPVQPEPRTSLCPGVVRRRGAGVRRLSGWEVLAPCRPGVAAGAVPLERSSVFSKEAGRATHPA